jgi:hypothetical protein
MKTFYLFLSIFFVANLTIAQEKIELPFFDNFEETISNDATFTNWTTENLEGWHYWHIIPWNGNPGHVCAFENTDINQNDWLITKPINCSGAENLKVNFSHLYHASNVPPKLYYTSQYNGHASQSTWKELAYSFGANENQWYQSDDFIIENPGDVIYFAFHYQAAANAGTYFLLDNFSVKSYKPITYTLSDSSQYFTFYTTLENGEDYWNEISEDVDNWYIELCSYWDRPGITPIFNSDKKTAIYLLNPNNFAEQSETELPDWKCGYFPNSNSIITKLPIGENSMYDNSYSTLVKNTFGQFNLCKHFGNNIEDYFKEGFGLFYTGYQPKRDSILKAISIFGNKPSIDVLNNLTNLSSSFQKDLITSFVESKVLSVGGVQNCYGGGMTEHWYSHLEYYYIKPDNESIKLLKQTERFNIYAADSDITHLEAISNKLEEKLSYYETTFYFPVKHRIYCVVYPTIQARGDCLIISSGNGGSGWSGDKLDISSKNEGWQDNDYYGFLIPHELFHVFHFNLVKHLFLLPAIYSEGLANFMSLHNNSGYLDGTEWQIYKIHNAFYHYTYNYNIEPKFENILNSQADEQFGGYYNDPYYFGELFYNYLLPSEVNFTDLKILFFNNLDYSKIGKSYDNIAKGYITFLKKHARLIPSEQMIKIPFTESFDDFNNGWGKPSYSNPDSWQIDEKGANGTNCVRFYTGSDKNTPIESWLISPPLDAKNMEQITLSFDFARYGDGIEQELFYTNNFEEYTDSSNWTSIKKIEMPNDWGWSNTGEITITNPPDTVFIGLQMKTTGEQHQQLYIDNYMVNGIVTRENEEIALGENNFNIYPNPGTSESFISFETQKSENVNLSVFDIQGRKICTLLNENLNAGTHTIQLGNLIKANGVYLCKLATSEGVSTLKLIVNNQ